MKGLLFTLVMLAGAASQQPNPPPAHGVLYGRVTREDQRPAQGINLVAYPLNLFLAAPMPRTTTDQDGRYRFDDIPWWARYTVVPDDPEAGYSIFATGAPLEGTKIQEVTLSPEHPQAEFNFRLPPKAGLLHFHLLDKRTGAKIPDIHVVLSPRDAPEKILFGEGCDSNRPILIPPDKDLLLHVDAEGYSEWERSVGKGLPLRMSAGEHRTLEVQLAPKD